MAEKNGCESPEIRIAQNGTWYFRNIEMTRTDIIHYFYQHLYRDPQGDYHIKTDKERCLIRVDDVPFIIEGIDLQLKGANGQACMMIQLSDGTCEELQPDTLWIGNNNVVYCRIKKSEHAARFSRKAYYQLAKYVEDDGNLNRYSITIGNISYPLTEKQMNENGGNHVR